MAEVTYRDTGYWLEDGVSFMNHQTRTKLLKAGSFTLDNSADVSIYHGGATDHNSWTILARVWAIQQTGEITVPVVVSAGSIYHSRYLSYATAPSILWHLTDDYLVFEQFVLAASTTVYYRIYQI